MTELRNLLVDLFYRGRDPFANEKSFSGREDYQGWSSDNPLLFRAIDEIRPKIVVEVGVWKGSSVITMAKEIKRLGLNACVIAIDTWVGSWEHWAEDQMYPSLRLEDGYPTLFKTFAANICAQGLQEYVLPLPLDSLNAGSLLKRKGISPDVIHLDGGHDYENVISDLKMWWPILAPGGAFIGDDYFLDGQTWFGVKQAFDEFFYAPNLEVVISKCWAKKAA